MEEGTLSMPSEEIPNWYELAKNHLGCPFRNQMGLWTFGFAQPGE